MTTVAALTHGGAVWMAADSLVSVYDRPVNSFRKIRRIPAGTGEVLIGGSGAAGMASAITADLKIDAEPAPDQDPQLWAEAIAHAITSLAFDHHQTDDGRMDAHLILGWNGNVWTIGNGVAVHHPDGVAAAGSGEGPAIGAIDTLRAERADWPPHKVVEYAVKVAISRDKHSAHPIHTEHLPPAVGRSVAAATVEG